MWTILHGRQIALQLSVTGFQLLEHSRGVAGHLTQSRVVRSPILCRWNLGHQGIPPTDIQAVVDVSAGVHDVLLGDAPEAVLDVLGHPGDLAIFVYAVPG